MAFFVLQASFLFAIVTNCVSDIKQQFGQFLKIKNIQNVNLLKL
ncbi:Uncharacterized protein dnm_075660 [Desulfonema magnum]|uniref:Uncharacterized protein n=1 Tax=Desulfonema magnum TaxID=45655 RepID=A0A975GSW3_9BACT|nr:Uncharacterized protein dnm_075660 [Desulfonema magnum]